MSRITPAIRDRLRADLAAARAVRRSGDHALSWELLEGAHVLSQPSAVWHVRVPGSMPLAGVRAGDIGEVGGQLVRLSIAGPGTVSGRYPCGNTVRTRVPVAQPMPIRDDLAELLREAGR